MNEKVEMAEARIYSCGNSIVGKPGEHGLVNLSLENLNYRVWQWDDLDDVTYKSRNTMVVIFEDGTITFQSRIISNGVTTRFGDPMKLNLQLFNPTGLRILNWDAGVLGISCGQNNIKQFTTSLPQAYTHTSRIIIDFSRHGYRSC